MKDAKGMSRYQRHEIIKYVRSRLPIFLAQCHQLMQNILCILSNLTTDEKMELVVYLVPEVRSGDFAINAFSLNLFLFLCIRSKPH